MKTHRAPEENQVYLDYQEQMVMPEIQEFQERLGKKEIKDP